MKAKLIRYTYPVADGNGNTWPDSRNGLIVSSPTRGGNAFVIYRDREIHFFLIGRMEEDGTITYLSEHSGIALPQKPTDYEVLDAAVEISAKFAEYALNAAELTLVSQEMRREAVKLLVPEEVVAQS